MLIGLDKTLQAQESENDGTQREYSVGLEFSGQRT